MINNLELIKSLLTFESIDDFYHAQIIKRKKEHPELGSNNYCVKTYYIDSLESLDRSFPEMKCLADFHNVRVCINLNRRSYEKIAFHLLKKVADNHLNKEYKAMSRSYSTVTGSFSAGKEKLWLVDIDEKDVALVEKVAYVIDCIEPREAKAVTYIPTKNGYHLITKPFNTRVFDETYPELDVHKDNPTIVYCP